MVDLTIQAAAEAGLQAVYTPASGGGDAALNIEGDVVLHVKNTDAAARTVTVTAQKTSKPVGGFGTMTKADAVVAVPAGEERFIGPFAPQAFNDAAAKVQVTYSATANLTIAALKIPRAT